MSNNIIKKEKNCLYDVVVIRLLLIFLLVTYHALCIYCGEWEPPYRVNVDIPFYEVLGILSYSFMLETFVFISGLLFGYTAIRKPQTLTLRVCCIKKAKRILLPCMIFGAIYYAMFLDLRQSVASIFYSVLTGCGHLWFLPMLFWCFVTTCLLVKFTPPYRWNTISKIIMAFSMLCSIFMLFRYLPMRLDFLGKYYFFFFLGFGMGRQNYKLRIMSVKHLWLIFVIYIFMFSCYLMLRKELDASVENVVWIRFIMRTIMNVSKMIMSLSAIYFLYVFSKKNIVLRYLDSHPRIVQLSSYCYGTYIFQQFILKIFYYKTNIACNVPDIFLPWCAIVLTLLLSLILTYCVLQTKVGRYLIG